MSLCGKSHWQTLPWGRKNIHCSLHSLWTRSLSTFHQDLGHLRSPQVTWGNVLAAVLFSETSTYPKSLGLSQEVVSVKESVHRACESWLVLKVAFLSFENRLIERVFKFSLTAWDKHFMVPEATINQMITQTQRVEKFHFYKTVQPM